MRTIHNDGEPTPRQIALTALRMAQEQTSRVLSQMAHNGDAGDAEAAAGLAEVERQVYVARMLLSGRWAPNAQSEEPAATVS